MSFMKLLDTCRDNDVWLGTTDRGVDLLRTLHAADPLAAASLVGHELAKVAAEQTEYYEAQGSVGPVSIAAVNAEAAKRGVSFEDAAALIDLDWQEQEALLDLGPRFNNVAFLDTTELSEAPEPWNEDHWQRDSRRAQAADLDVSRSVWAMHAEQGKDVVAELIRERLERTLGEIRRRKVMIADAAQRQGEDRAREEREAADGPNYIQF